MTFPTIPTVAAGRVLFQLNTNPAGTHTFPNLSSLTKNSGDRLVAICIIYDGNSTNAEFSSWGGGFTERADQAGTATMGIGVADKISDGTETGTFTVTSADTSGNDSCCILLSIPNAHPSTPIEAGTMATGTSAAADPGSFNPAGWDAEDTLWIAVGGSGEVSTTGSYTGIASAPANYSDYADSGISADVVGGVEGAVAFRQLNAASEDVGTFSVDVSNARNAAILIAVRPTNAQTIGPAGAIASEEAFGTAKLNLEIDGAGNIASAEAFGDAKLNFTILNVGAIASEEAFGSHTLTQGEGGDTIAPSGIASEEAFGTAALDLTILNVGAIASAEAFGTLALDLTILNVGAIGSAEAFGNASVFTAGGPLTIANAGAIASAEAFGTLSIDLEIADAGAIASAEAFGAATLASQYTIADAGNIASGEAFGNHALLGGAVIVVEPGKVGASDARAHSVGSSDTRAHSTGAGDS